MPLSEDSLKILESVKKTGKPCKFVMVSKAAKPLSIVAFRKGSEQTHIKEAKESGKGTVVCGVVDTAPIEVQGANLSFKLQKSECDSPPVARQRLKDFLNEGSKSQWANPAIDIVEALPTVEMEGDGQQPPQSGKYRTGDEWKTVIAAIQLAKDKQERDVKLAQAARDWNNESQRVTVELQTTPDSQAALTAQETLRKVSAILKVLTTGPQLPPLPQTPGQQTTPQQPPLGPPPQRQLPPTPVPQQQAPPQLPPLPSTPPPNRPVPLNPAQQEEADRQALKLGASTKAKAINEQVKPIFGGAERKKALEDTESDLDSDFGKIMVVMDIGTRTHDALIVEYQNAQTMAAKYIKDHPDPRIGKQQPRVQKRKDLCQKLIDDVNKQIQAMRDQNERAVEFAKTYETLANKGSPVPFEVSGELQTLLKNRYLSDATKQKLKDTSDLIMRANRQSATQSLQQLQNPTDTEKADILLKHGCFKGAGGGTSGVKLLTDAKGNIEFAFKPTDDESPNGLDFLQQETGASAMREAVSSTLCEELKNLGLDLGFPKTDIVRAGGKCGALIEGIKGKMADPEELDSKRNEILSTRDGTPERAKLEQDRDEMIRNIQTIPTQISPESLQDVVLSSMLTCQWDCKWGNMIVDGNRARPIDGGTAIPTPDVVKTFRDKTNLHGARTPFLSGITQYPDYTGDPPNPHRGETLPQAKQPMDPQKVAALLKINPDQLLQSSKTKRDQLVRDNPELKATMMDDSCFDIVKASITGVQSILRKNPTITLEQFALEYEQWFATWGDQYAQA